MKFKDPLINALHDLCFDGSSTGMTEEQKREIFERIIEKRAGTSEAWRRRALLYRMMKIRGEV